MAKITFKGIEEYTAKLRQLSALTEEKVIGAAVYDGAGIVADAIRAQLDSVPTDEHWGTPEYPKAGPSQLEKDALKESLGVTPMRTDNGFTNVKIGFDGYNSDVSRKYPRGHPNQMIARAVESGTSFMPAHPFMKAAVRQSRKAAEAAMAKRVEQEIEKIMG